MNSYLIKKQNTTDLIIGGDRDTIGLNNMESKILDFFCENPRGTYSEAALKCGCAGRTAVSLLKGLKKRGILLAFRSELTESLGLYYHRIMLSLNNITPEREEELVKFCRNRSTITVLSKTIGSWDIEIDVRNRTLPAFRQTYQDIRHRFRDIIRTFNSYPLYKLHLKRAMPRKSSYKD